MSPGRYWSGSQVPTYPISRGVEGLVGPEAAEVRHPRGVRVAPVVDGQAVVGAGPVGLHL